MFSTPAENIIIIIIIITWLQLKTKLGDSVPLLRSVYDKFIYEEEPPEPPPRSKPRDKDDKEFLSTQLLQVYKSKYRVEDAM